MPDWGLEIRKRLAGARMSPAHEADVVEELSQHLEDRHRELLAQGVAGELATQRVLEELNQSEGLVRALEEVRPGEMSALSGDVTLGGGRATGRLHGFWQDVRYSLRVMWKTPTFTVAALLALGLGTGAATAVFSLLDGVVLRPLPFRQPDRLAMVWETNLPKGLTHEPLSPVNLMDYRSLSGAFSDVAAWWRPETNLIDRAGEPVRVQTVETSENLFKVLGVDAALGRTFPVTPALFSTESEAVISDRLWRDRFGADPNIIGKPVQLNASPYVVVGVMPPGFHFPANTDVWQRLQWDMKMHSRDAHFMEAVGRLRDGATIEQANRDLAALTTRLGSEFKHTNEGWGAQAIELNADVAGVFRPGLFALFGASGLLLLIACMNVANLLLARGAARQPEVAVRAALGATRFRLMQQFLVESLLLATFGTLFGFLIAALSLRGFLAWTPIAIPRADEIHINLLVLGFTAAITVGTAIIFGLAPAMLASRADLQRALKANARGSTGERAGKRARTFLVVAEIALAVALLAGAGLLIRSVEALMNEKTGVATSDAVVVDVQLSGANYRDWNKVSQFYNTLITAIRAHPRIVAVGAANFLPLEVGWRIPFGIDGLPLDADGEKRMVQYHAADDGYFAAIGAPVLRGRTFDTRDTETSHGVAIINQTLARRYYPNEDPVGKHITDYSHNVGPLGKRLTVEDDAEIIGVVADVKNNSLKSEVEPALYLAARQYPFRKMYLVVRGTADAAALVAIVRSEVKRLDPALPLGEPRTIQRVLAASADPPRFVMLLMSVFAALALVLAAIGVYGILSYTVHQRSRELGIRMALGARPRDVLRLVVREGVGMGVMGAAVGVVIAVSAGKALSSLLYNVKPVDPVTLSGVVVLVLGVALLACVAPGRRAAHTDPVRTLRGD